MSMYVTLIYGQNGSGKSTDTLNAIIRDKSSLIVNTQETIERINYIQIALGSLDSALLPMTIGMIIVW
ncbi:hypothetical protein [Erwinia mallotivora]|uniref:hypothetical protein n=2 Tax=Erwinia mallotivora TaxID=69222 RepID=UPI0021BE0F38|nr:hypothetical protein [Erwinia mallotivora]